MCSPSSGALRRSGYGAESGPPVGVLYLDSREKGTLLSVPTTSVLETLANEAAVAIENAKLYRAALEKAKLEQEMQTAADIQQALLPTQNRTGVFFDVAAEMLPCRSIGGDFFDYIDLPDGVFGFALGDVAGKGPPAALLGAIAAGVADGAGVREPGASRHNGGGQHGARPPRHPGTLRDVVLRCASSRMVG